MWYTPWQAVTLRSKSQKFTRLTAGMALEVNMTTRSTSCCYNQRVFNRLSCCGQQCVSSMTYVANNWLGRQFLHCLLHTSLIIVRAAVSTSLFLSLTFPRMWSWSVLASIPWLWPWPMSSIAWSRAVTAIAWPRSAFTVFTWMRPATWSWSPTTAMIAAVSQTITIREVPLA